MATPVRGAAAVAFCPTTTAHDDPPAPVALKFDAVTFELSMYSVPRMSSPVTFWPLLLVW